MPRKDSDHDIGAPKRVIGASKEGGSGGPPGRSSAESVDAGHSEADESRALALRIAALGLEHKALNVEIIDVWGKVDYADFVVLMSGRSDRQVTALAQNIDADLARQGGSRCLGMEGMTEGRWVLMDYGDVIVHIFHEDTRGYYDLETLWIDAARVSVEP